VPIFMRFPDGRACPGPVRERLYGPAPLVSQPVIHAKTPALARRGLRLRWKVAQKVRSTRIFVDQLSSFRPGLPAFSQLEGASCTF